MRWLKIELKTTMRLLRNSSFEDFAGGSSLLFG